MAKKKKKPAIKLGRATWHIRGVTQVQKNGKAYNRQKSERDWRKEE